MRVLSIDIGLRVSGYVVCEAAPDKVQLLCEGEIKPNPKDTLPQRLFDIYSSLSNVIHRRCPDAVVLEKLYSHHRHPTTMAALAQVRGVVLLLVRMHHLALHEYSPTRARKSFLGRGNVRSHQVKKMAENMLGQRVRSEHTADAFSLVIAFSHALKVSRLYHDRTDKRHSR